MKGRRVFRYESRNSHLWQAVFSSMCICDIMGSSALLGTQGTKRRRQQQIQTDKQSVSIENGPQRNDGDKIVDLIKNSSNEYTRASVRKPENLGLSCLPNSFQKGEVYLADRQVLSV